MYFKTFLVSFLLVLSKASNLIHNHNSGGISFEDDPYAFETGILWSSSFSSLEEEAELELLLTDTSSPVPSPRKRVTLSPLTSPTLVTYFAEQEQEKQQEIQELEEVEEEEEVENFCFLDKIINEIIPIFQDDKMISHDLIKYVPSHTNLYSYSYPYYTPFRLLKSPK